MHAASQGDLNALDYFAGQRASSTRRGCVAEGCPIHFTYGKAVGGAGFLLPSVLAVGL